MSFLGKEYTFYKHENFDNFLKSVGVPEDKMQPLLAFKFSQKMEKSGDSYISTMDTPEGPKNVTFKSGVEFDNVMANGEPVKSTFTINGSTVTHTVKGEKGTATFKGEYNGDELVMTITTDKWDGVARRYYKA